MKSGSEGVEDDRAGPPHTGECGTFVTLGTSSKYRFSRLLDCVVEASALLPRPIVVQHAGNQYDLPPDFVSVPFLDAAAYRDCMARARLIVSHAGVGTIIDAIRLRKPIVCLARRMANNEACDDHQREFLGELRKHGLDLEFTDTDELMRRARFPPPPPHPTALIFAAEALARQARNEIRRLAPPDRPPRIALVATSGGHLTELLETHAAWKDESCFFVTSKPIDQTVSSHRPTYVYRCEERDWRMLRNTLAIARMLLRERPDVIVTTGSGSALPVILLARLLVRSKVVFLESLTRVSRPTLAGRLLYACSHSVIYRWPRLRDIYRRGAYVPALLTRHPATG